MVPAFSSVKRYTSLAFGLRDFLKSPITLEQSIELVTARLRNREANFLDLVQRCIYQNPASPYLKLLKVAGCAFEDIKALIEKEGIEPTLKKLLDEGVYFSFEEFKGKRDTVRGGKHFLFKESDFDNPLLPVNYQVETSGTRSKGSKTIFDFSHRLDASYYSMLSLAAVDALNIPLALWMPVPPSIAGVGNLLDHAKFGQPVAKWFSPVDEREVRTPLKHRLALRYIVFWGRFWGARLAYPEKVSIQDAAKIAYWLESMKKLKGNSALICSSAGMAVKVCEAAIEQGMDIRGIKLFVSGEPLTEVKRQKMESAGAEVISRYSNTEIGRMGIGCNHSQSIDEVHLLHDRVAIIQRKRGIDFTDTQVDSFLLTSLLQSAPKLMFNVEVDDCGVLEKHECSCLLGRLGYNRHLHDIRSFSKLTGSGMTIIGSELVATLEKTLPNKFGGGPADYQLLEEEDEKGKTTLSLVISPEVRKVNETEVVTTFLDELRKNAAGGKLAAGLWSQSQTIKIKRIYPLSRGGKIMTLHLKKKGE